MTFFFSSQLKCISSERPGARVDLRKMCFMTWLLKKAAQVLSVTKSCFGHPLTTILKTKVRNNTRSWLSSGHEDFSRLGLHIVAATWTSQAQTQHLWVVKFKTTRCCTSLISKARTAQLWLCMQKETVISGQNSYSVQSLHKLCEQCHTGHTAGDVGATAHPMQTGNTPGKVNRCQKFK